MCPELQGKHTFVNHRRSLEGIVCMVVSSNTTAIAATVSHLALHGILGPDSRHIARCQFDLREACLVFVDIL